MIGRTIGGYRIVEQIGMGGMATVYKAYDPSTDRYVALKTLPEQYSKDPQFVERFRREARAIAKLEHLHILPLFAYGEDEGTAYLAMRYLPAGTLSNHIQQQGQIPLADITRILNQIASALDHAHANGVLHRDIKPSNVLIDNDANVYLTDFGIARMVEGTVDLTGDAILGTPQYMSPEQCQGRKDLTPASDQYSLGVVLYEMVTGRVPFQAETPLAVIIMQINGAELPLPTTLRPDLPEAAERVILKALARDPANRYPSCEALAKAFAQTVSAELLSTRANIPPETKPALAPSTTPSIDNAATTLQPSPTRPALSPMLIGAGIVVAVIIIAGIALLAGRPTAETPVVVSLSVTATLEPTTGQIAAVPSATPIPPTALPTATSLPATIPPTTTSIPPTATPVPNSLPAIVATLIAQDDVDAAIKLLSPAIDSAPQDAALLLLRGQAYRKAGNQEAALADLTQAIKLAPDLTDAYVQRAYIYYDQNNTPATIQDLTQAIQLQPNRADIYALRGIVLRGLNEYDKALADYGKAIDLDSKNPQWYSERATVYEWSGDLENALADLNKAIALNPQFTDAYIQRGYDQHQREQYELALADFMRARELDPNNVAAYSGPVETYLSVLDAGNALAGYDLDKALADANKALELVPDDSTLYIERAKIYSRRDDHDAAISDLTQSIKLYDQSPDAYIVRGYEYTATSRFDQAHADFDKALQLNPESVDAYQGRVEAYLEAVDNDKPWPNYNLDAALADANKALDLDGGNAVSLLLRGKVYGRLGDKEKALSDLGQTIEMQPAMAWGYEERGQVYASIGMIDAAVADLQKAIELEPANTWTYAQLGDVLYDAGRKPEALKAYQTYIQKVGPEGASEYIRERIVELEKTP